MATADPVAERIEAPARELRALEGPSDHPVLLVESAAAAFLAMQRSAAEDEGH